MVTIFAQSSVSHWGRSTMNVCLEKRFGGGSYEEREETEEEPSDREGEREEERADNVKASCGSKFFFTSGCLNNTTLPKISSALKISTQSFSSPPTQNFSMVSIEITGNEETASGSSERRVLISTTGVGTEINLLEQT